MSEQKYSQNKIENTSKQTQLWKSKQANQQIQTTIHAQGESNNHKNKNQQQHKSNKDDLNEVNVDEIKLQDEDDSEKQLQQCTQQDLQKANQHKNKGNEYFKVGNQKDAIQQYKEGLKYTKDHKLRATLYSNISISYIKFQDYKQAKKYCKKVLRQDQNHRKGRMNLARCYQEQKKIEEAFQEYKKLQQNLDGASDKDIKYIKQKITSLKPKVDQLNQSRKKEVMDGLKNIGNSILGYFGMSLDNFKLQQGANGGYNISFKQ